MILILISSSLFYFYWYRNPKPVPPPSLKVVETKILQLEKIQKTIRLIGTVRPKHTTLLVAKETGLLDIVRFSGEKVHKGELIAQLNIPDIETKYQLSKDAATIAHNQYNRFLNLQKKGFVSIREVEEKKQNWIDTQKELARTKMERENTSFLAPFDGIIGAYKIKEGSQVHPGEALVTVYNANKVSVDLDVPCSHIKNINKNQRAYVFNRPYKINHIQQMMDEESHMCPADIDIECKSCILGDTVFVNLVIQSKSQALVIPSQALLLKNGTFAVYKVVNKHAELTPIKIGIETQDQIEVISGLQVGDELISKNPERIYPGLEIAIYKTPTNKKQA